MKPQAENVVRRCDSQQVMRALLRLRSSLSARTWLEGTNPYRLDPVAILRGDLSNKPPTVRSDEIADYIAASTVLHCTDGWSSLGRALNSLCHGDAPTAVHVAYYAALRASMSILAAQSIGVFGTQHVVLTTGGKTRPILSVGTHDFAWDALSIWSATDVTGRRIPALMRLPGHSIEDWLDEFDPAFDLGPHCEIWLRRCGIDAARSKADEGLRDLASYRPSEYASGRDTGVRTASTFLDSLWRASEPTSVPFELLVKHVLRITLELVAAETNMSVSAYRGAIGRTVDAMIDPPACASWRDFLLRTTEPSDLLVIELARRSSSYGGANEHLEVMARAFLLLVVATFSCADLLASAKYGRRRLAFWWQRYGAERGLWSRTSPPAQFQDLWGEVRNALDDVQQWTSRQRAASPSIAMWRNRLAVPLATLASPERIALWGLSL